MRERPGSGDETSAGEEVKGRAKRIDLSVPQVAGSAVAAVVAAKLASYFGVYGTILGAGLVSVVATCGGSVFQHFFRRTGEQFRDAAATGSGTPRPREQAPPAFGEFGESGEFTEGTVYRARVRTRRRPLVAATLVFTVTMAGITAYELVSGDAFGGGSGTTVGSAVTGDTTSSGSSSSSGSPGSSDATGSPDTSGSSGANSGDGTAASPTPSPSSSSGTSGASGSDGTATPAPSPSGSADGSTGGSADGEPSATPTPDGSSATAPAPSADSRSGTAGQDRAGPAAR
ncbi:hypothetical protein AB0D74_20555 [Streptomyces sp. NPDC048278]|uniref:hypothetical protein n=1 Tax=Streptomyces sp. NPDC048278 TaxID=3155809 RepID=UPI0034279C05